MAAEGTGERRWAPRFPPLETERSTRHGRKHGTNAPQAPVSVKLHGDTPDGRFRFIQETSQCPRVFHADEATVSFLLKGMEPDARGFLALLRQGTAQAAIAVGPEEGVLTSWRPGFWVSNGGKPVAFPLGERDMDGELAAGVITRTLGFTGGASHRIPVEAFMEKFWAGASKGHVAIPRGRARAWLETHFPSGQEGGEEPPYGAIARGFSGEGHLAEPIVGFRTWLVAASAHTHGGVLTSFARPGSYWSIYGHTWATHPDGSLFSLPHLDGECECGLHAYGGLWRAIDEAFAMRLGVMNAFDLSLSDGTVLGAVQASGRTALHRYGWRAEAARVLAILDPASLGSCDGKLRAYPWVKERCRRSGQIKEMRRRATAAARLYRVPILGAQELESFAMENGQPATIEA